MKKKENIKKALIIFLEAFRNKIINKSFNADLLNEENLSFNIYGFIPPINYLNYDEIIFLDEKYEELAKNGIKFQIKVKLIEKFNNKYYMIFEGANIEKEFFYRYIKDIKYIAKTLL